MPDTEPSAPAPILADVLAPGLDVIFVGAAPSRWSEQARRYYAGPNNRFWTLLHGAGFTPRRLRPEEDGEVLNYGVGLTGLFRHIASGANHLLPPPTEELREVLTAKLLANAPRWVAFNGKDVYGMATGRVSTDWGEQAERIGDSRVFVVHSSSARADAWGAQRLALYQELKALVDEDKGSVEGSRGHTNIHSAIHSVRRTG